MHEYGQDHDLLDECRESSTGFPPKQGLHILPICSVWGLNSLEVEIPPSCHGSISLLDYVYVCILCACGFRR
jgi:hypothetical protein